MDDTLTVEREIGFEDVVYEAYTPARTNCLPEDAHPAEGGGVESYKAFWVDQVVEIKDGKRGMVTIHTDLTPLEIEVYEEQIEEFLNDNSESFISEPDPDAEYDARHERWPMKTETEQALDDFIKVENACMAYERGIISYEQTLNIIHECRRRWEVRNASKTVKFNAI